MAALGLSGLIGAYVLVGTLLLGIVLLSNWPWKIKAGAIIITSFFYTVTYLSFPPLFGWPVADKLPARFRLLAAHVEPPDQQTEFKGAIYLWLGGIEDLSTPQAPRAYRLKYTQPLHEQLLNTLSKLNKGIAQLGEYHERPESSGDITPPGQKSGNIIFYDLPDPMFPDK